MPVELEDLAEAVEIAHAVLREHEVQAHEYLGLSDDARNSIRRMISGQIDQSGIPRSRRLYHEQLLMLTEVGMIVGVELGRARAAREKRDEC